MTISCFCGRHGDLMTHLQYSVPVAVLYLCWLMTIVETVNWTVFAMHCSSSSFSTVCPFVLSPDLFSYFLFPSVLGKWPSPFFFTHSFCRARRKCKILAALSVVTVFPRPSLLHVGAVSVFRRAAGSIYPPWIFRFEISSSLFRFYASVASRFLFISVFYVFRGCFTSMFGSVLSKMKNILFLIYKNIMLESNIRLTCPLFLKWKSYRDLQDVQ